MRDIETDKTKNSESIRVCERSLNEERAKIQGEIVKIEESHDAGMRVPFVMHFSPTNSLGMPARRRNAVR